MKTDRHTTKISIAKEVMPAKREINRIIHGEKREGSTGPRQVDKSGRGNKKSG